MEKETSTAKDVSPQQGRLNKLIIGSSMVKGIEPRGLQPDIRINVNRGADSMRITKKLHYMDLSNLSDVIIYAGGNDGPNRTPPRKTEAHLEVAIETALEQGCKIWLCLIAPRVDSNVVPLNNMLKKLASFYQIKIIDLYSEVTKQGFISNKYYARDGIQFNKAGNSLLVHCIDQFVTIVKAQTRHIVAQHVIENRYTAPSVCTFPESHHSQEWSTSSSYPAILRNALNINQRRNSDDGTLFFKQQQYNNRATSHQQRNNHNQQSDSDRDALYYYYYYYYLNPDQQSGSGRDALNYNFNNQQRDSYRRSYTQQSESERDTLYLRNYMYYKKKYQLQNVKADGHWDSYYADPYPSERETVSLDLNGYSCV